MLMGANHGAVDMMQAPVEFACGVRLLLTVGQDAIPDPVSPPAIEAGGNCLPGTVLLRQIPPGRSRAIEPQEAVEDLAMVLRGAALPGWFLRWKQRPQPLPLLVGHVSSAHV